MKFIVTGPSTLQLAVKIMKNIRSSSIVVQWDAVNDSFPTTYTVTWTRAGGGLPQVATLTEQTSYTITGLTLDTVYTITVSATNKCGSGPEFRTSIILSRDTTSTTSSPLIPSTTTIVATTSKSVTTVRRNIDITSKTITTIDTDSCTTISTTITTLSTTTTTPTTTTTTTTVAKSSSSTVATIAVTDPKTGKFSVTCICTITIIASIHNCLTCSLL